MKIQASFVDRPWRWQLVTGMAGAFSIALLSASALLWLDAAGMNADRPQLQRRLAKLSAQIEKAPGVDLPDEATRRSLREKVAALNRQAAPKGWATAELLVWLEQKAPADVHFLSIQHKARDGEALLLAESTSIASLTAFLRGLEQEPAFAEVLLSKQGGRAASGDAVRFEIRLRLAA